MSELPDLFAGLARDFESQQADLRHVLLSLDHEILNPPPSWDVPDDDGVIRWGLPPDEQWRRYPDEEELQPVILQELEWAFPLLWRHTFTGARAFRPFKKLAYRSLQAL